MVIKILKNRKNGIAVDLTFDFRACYSKAYHANLLMSQTANTRKSCATMRPHR